MRFIKYIILTFIFISTWCTYAQTPGINYQAFILNQEDLLIPGANVSTNNIPLTLEDVNFRFTITGEDPSDYLYIEEQLTTTDENGLVSLVIGEGLPSLGEFEDILWDGTVKYLNVDVDILSNNEGYTLLDTQKILYLPQSVIGKSNVKIVRSLPLNNNTTGDLVLHTDDNGTSTLNVWKDNEWISIGSYYTNGLTKTGNKVELGGALTKPTEITTDNTNTLAIQGLNKTALNDNDLVVIDRTTGVLKKVEMSSLTQERTKKVVFATDGQTQFTPPLPVDNLEKISVYRNGVRISFDKINNSTIKLETGVVCYENDEIRIIQVY